MRNLQDNIVNNPAMTMLCVALIALAIFIIYVNFFAVNDREIERIEGEKDMQEVRRFRQPVPSDTR